MSLPASQFLSGYRSRNSHADYQSHHANGNRPQPVSQPEELEDVLYSNLEELTRMAKMVSDMLFLAQADNNQLIPENAQLADEVGKVFDFSRR